MLLDVIFFIRRLFEEQQWHESSYQFTWEVHSKIRFVAAIFVQSLKVFIYFLFLLQMVLKDPYHLG